MAMAVGPGRGVKSDINVTPLVDVVLVLLIIFMVVTPMLQRGKEVQLPKTTKVAETTKGPTGDPIIVSVTKDKAIYIEKDKFEENAFEAALKAKIDADPGKRILLKGDQALAFEEVRKVMNMARNAGAKAVHLGVEEEKGKEGEK